MDKLLFKEPSSRNFIYYDSSSEEENEVHKSAQSTSELDTNADIIFVNDDGASLHFILCLKDEKKALQLQKLVEDRAGCAWIDIKYYDDYTVILADDVDYAVSLTHTHDVFKVSYIHRCIKEEKVLDISKFLHGKSSEFVNDFDFMEVFYYRKYTWKTVPEEFRCKKTVNGEEEDEEEIDRKFAEGPCIISSKKDKLVRKQTRDPYSFNEKKAILTHIVKYNLYGHLRGVAAWKEMECVNICPKRTWQSMKEHTLKTISKELDSYNFLTQDQKKKLKNVMTSARHS